MAITVTEKHDSREVETGDSPSAVLRYVIKGTADDGEAKTALGNEAPATYDSLVRTGREVRPVFVDVNNPDISIWDGTVRYGLVTRPQTGESVFEFDTGGGSQHITQSRDTVGVYAAPGYTALNFQGAIAVSGHTVQGVDITVPVYNWGEQHYLDDSYVTETYKRTLAGLTGMVNNAAFRGFERGEVLFLGARGSKRGEGDWEISFRFAASPNRSGITIGPITGIIKGGWEYLWVRYTSAEDEDGKELVQRPVAVYVEKVYEYGDFSQLGIGT